MPWRRAGQLPQPVIFGAAAVSIRADPAGPPVLHQARDDKHDPEGFIETWLSSVHALGSRGGPTAGP
jgi:hypothetical protein